MHCERAKSGLIYRLQVQQKAEAEETRLVTARYRKGPQMAAIAM